MVTPNGFLFCRNRKIHRLSAGRQLVRGAGGKGEAASAMLLPAMADRLGRVNSLWDVTGTLPAGVSVSFGASDASG